MVDLLHYRVEKETFTLFMGKSPEYQTSQKI